MKVLLLGRVFFLTQRIECLFSPLVFIYHNADYIIKRKYQDYPMKAASDLIFLFVEIKAKKRDIIILNGQLHPFSYF